MPNQAPVTITLDPHLRLGTIDRRIFGSFVEHLGRAVYTGIYEPGHPTADAYGFRRDVAELATELGVTLLRYPGGNFVSSYRWEDGIGPVAERPRRLDLAWRTLESNRVGTDEFLSWCRRLGVEPMMAVNLGTRGIEAAADLVEYCNIPGGTTLSDRRRSNGSPEPYGVRLWCLGNEMDGPWQVGRRDADEYGRLAARVGHAMRRVDPTIELVACGSSGRQMPTFGAWERTVLEHTYEVADYLSLHAYYEEHDGDRASFLGSGAAMDRFIADVIATADSVGARLGSPKRMKLSFDEWNVWYMSETTPVDTSAILPEGSRLFEDRYRLLDAVVVGDLLITLLNHADRVRVACLAQLVNVIAPIATEPGGDAWRLATFYPFAHTARAARGTALRPVVETPTLETARHGEVPATSCAATYDPDEGTAAVFLVNRTDRPVTARLRHPDFPGWTVAGCASIVADHGGKLVTAEAARAAEPVEHRNVRPGAAQTEVDLAPESWTVLRIRVGE
ncbi:alpha-N-arabinofuranosidase [Micromonospora sp. HM5-17]|uniref:arabinosylfuranosidase ArfA n=1 Tax=Micromonospora sp. HM5-17 TaxID=2487710 RepID=UPI000F4676FB|nr:alpha-N-arabinofuranosidase [Micromonospora sp. HM5-17]ROT29772.1 alpha-N-arabinofuranosidase [Micromonospora sp. HM5-17]